MGKKILAKMTVNRRQRQRRTRTADPVLSSLVVFNKEERKALREMERRRALRRKEDVRRRVAAL